jgi:hypothetical protein
MVASVWPSVNPRLRQCFALAARAIQQYLFVRSSKTGRHCPGAGIAPTLLMNLAHPLRSNVSTYGRSTSMMPKAILGPSGWYGLVISWDAGEYIGTDDQDGPTITWQKDFT